MEKNLNNWINLSVRAPSGDNCQPWIFEFNESKFQIQIDEKKAIHYLDQNYCASWISLGALCENLENSAESFGFSCKIDIISEMAVMVEYSAIPPVVAKNLIDAIRKRATYRGKLSKVIFNLNFYKAGRIQSLAKYKWSQCEILDDSLINQWAYLESLLWGKTTLMKDFTLWVRINSSNYKDGITISNLMLSIADSISLMLFKFIPMLIKFVPKWCLRINFKKRLKYLLVNSSEVIYLEADLIDFNSYFYAGKEIQRMWLYLTEIGLSAQPLAIESLFFNYLENDITRKYFSEKEIKKIEKVKVDTLKYLNIKQNLVFMFRIGEAKEEIEITPRVGVSNEGP